MEGSDMNVSDKIDMVSTDMGMMSTDMGMMSTDMGMGMSGHQHGAHYRGMDGPGDESGKFILAVQILLPNMSPSQSDWKSQIYHNITEVTKFCGAKLSPMSFV